jgi:hypothetical protein
VFLWLKRTTVRAANCHCRLHSSISLDRPTEHSVCDDKFILLGILLVVAIWSSGLTSHLYGSTIRSGQFSCYWRLETSMYTDTTHLYEMTGVNFSTAYNYRVVVEVSSK